MNPDSIREHMMVHAKGEGSMMGAEGVHVGTVDKVEGSFIKLTRNDSPDGQHHYIPMTWVERVDDKAVYLSKNEQVVRREWTTEMPGNDGGSMGSMDSMQSTGSEPFTSNSEAMDRAAQAGNDGAFGQGSHSPATTREEAEAAFGGMSEDMSGGMSGSMSGSGAMGATSMNMNSDDGAAGIEQIGRASDTDLASIGDMSGMTGMAAGSGGATLGNMPISGTGSDMGLGASGTMDDGNGGTLGGPTLGGAGMAESGTGQMGLSENMTGLTSSGGSLMSDSEIAMTNSESLRSGDLTSDFGRIDEDTAALTAPYSEMDAPYSDSFASGFDDTTTDRTLMSGAAAMGGMMDDHNSATGKSGNVSEDQHGVGGLVGQGPDSADLANGGTVQGMDAYDNSYSGGSAAMPSAPSQPETSRVGGSAAQPDMTMNTNLDPALQGSDFDRESMGQGVDGTQAHQDDNSKG